PKREAVSSAPTPAKPAAPAPVAAKPAEATAPAAPRPVARPPVPPPAAAEPAREKTKVPAGFPEKREFPSSKPVRSPVASRRTPDEQTRLYMNLGEAMGVAPADVVGAILGETGLPGKTVG